MVLIPSEVPSSIISGFPNSAAIFDKSIPYFAGTGECLAISDTFLKFVFSDSDLEPRSLTRIIRLSAHHLLPDLFNLADNNLGSILFLNTLVTRSKTKGL